MGLFNCRILHACMVIILFGSVLSGCGFKDIDKRFFVTAMGVDKSDDKQKPLSVTLLLAIPSSTVEPGQAKFQVIQQNAKSVGEAVRLLKSKVDKELDFGHAKVYMFGESLAKSDEFAKALSWIDRRRDIQLEGYMSLARPSVAEVLKLTPLSERIAGNALILSFGRSGTDSAYVSSEYLFDFYRRSTEHGVTAYMPIVEIGKGGYNINKTALFKERRLASVLTPNETRILNELIGISNKFSITSKYEGKDIMLAADHINTSFSIHTPPNRRPYLRMKVHIIGIAEESEEVITEKNWNAIEAAMGTTMVEEYERFLKKLQKLGVDPIGFGLKYRATHFNRDRDWQDWQEIYPELDFKVEVKVSMKGLGMIH